jgi:ABC-type polar amino acid transport system ATPase subunit
MSLPDAVRLRAVYKSYGSTEVLSGLDLHVARGEKLALIGPSGSGKSTVLRLIVGLDQPDSGQLALHGETVFDAADPRSRRAASTHPQVGMVFQHFNLFPHMTVMRNVTLALERVRGLSREHAEARALVLLAQVGLADKLTAKPAQLSGGQRQRVAIARALALEPSIMLFDEITSALDPETVGEVLSVLRELRSHADMTMVLVTHQIGFARELSDRIAFMAGGAVLEAGSPSQLLDAPTHPRIQSFLRALL